MRTFVKSILRSFKCTVLSLRRRFARATVHSLQRMARRNRTTPLFVRLMLSVYFVKRTLQETTVRGWPMHSLRRNRWRREIETAFAMKLLRWAHDPLDRAADAYPLNRLNNRVTNADRNAMKTTAETWDLRPLVSILVPVYNAAPEWLDRLLSSILDQIYDRWELVLVDDASPDAGVWPTLKRWAERDSRIVIERSQSNGGVSAATSRAAELASGEFLAFADHDDEFTPDALWRMVEALQGPRDIDLVYSDEEIVPSDASPYPMFKPGWSPELLVSFNYICHLAMVRRTAFDAIGGFRPGFDGAQDHDLLLRLSTVARRVVHVPRILYRWHVGGQSMSRRVERKTGHVVAADGIADKTRRAVQDHLDRLNLDADATIVSAWCLPRYRPRSDVRPSIILCTKDNAACLRSAVQSIEGRTDGQEYELLIVDTGAETPEAQALLDELATRHRVLKYDGGGERFNWSRVNNWAAERATGDVVVFLNDDVEVLEPGWLSALTTMAMQPQVGAVGALLEYPDGRLQHAGVILGAHGWGPWHVLMGARLRQPTDYQGIAYFQRNCLAVTGACLAIRRILYLEIGGFDADKLAIGFSDVDLCVRLHRRGLRNVYLPQARLIHKEGQSRGMRIDAGEAAELATRTGGLVDPYWNPNFTRETHIPTISSRRLATGLRFAEGVRTLAVFGSDASAKGLPLKATAVHQLTSSSDRARLKERLESDSFDVVVAVGWDAEASVKAAADLGLPTLWHLPTRPMLDERFSPAAFQRFAHRWRTLDLSYQTIFPDLHSRAWLQSGWMRPNARVVERVVAGRSNAEIQRGRNGFLVAIESTPGEDESLACLQEALRHLDPKLRELVAVVCIDPRAVDVNDLAAADVFVTQPFRDLRSEAALTALSFGVPIVGSRYLEHADVMHVGVTGLQVDELDPDSLAKALEELLPDAARRKEMGRQAKAWLASRASCHWIDAEWRRLVEEAAELRTGRGDDSGEGDLPGNSGRSGAVQTRGILTTSLNDRS